MFSRDALNRLYRYAYSLTSDESEAYDVLQDGLERFLRSEAAKKADNPEAYARRIIRNRFIDRIRQENRSLEDLMDDLAKQPLDMDPRNLEGLMVARDELERIWAKLEPQDREILFLWGVEGLSAREVAEELDIPRGTILSRIHRLRGRLKAELEAQDMPSVGVQTT